MSTNGKGSARRGTDPASDAAYRAGWDAIFGGGKNTKRVHMSQKRTRSGTRTGQGLTSHTSSVKQGLRPIDKSYPAWVCYDCATKAGGRLRGSDSATFHTGEYGSGMSSAHHPSRRTYLPRTIAEQIAARVGGGL